MQGLRINSRLTRCILCIYALLTTATTWKTLPEFVYTLYGIILIKIIKFTPEVV